jgi:hypothetical protein
MIAITPCSTVLEWAAAHETFIVTAAAAVPGGIVTALNFTNMLKGWQDFKIARLQRLQVTAVPKIRILRPKGIVFGGRLEGTTVSGGGRVQCIPLANTNRYWKARAVTASLTLRCRHTGLTQYVHTGMWVRRDGTIADTGFLGGDVVVFWAICDGSEGFVPGLTKQGDGGNLSDVIFQGAGSYIYNVENGEWLLDLQLMTDNFIENYYFRLFLQDNNTPRLIPCRKPRNYDPDKW